MHITGMFTPARKKGSTKYGVGERIPEDLFNGFNMSKESKKAVLKS
jgi:hypothetical protein